jgi:predicted dehydrogenase
MSVLKCAIVGCGNIAGGYDTPESSLVRTHAKSFLLSDSCKLVGVSDIDKNIAKSFSKTWNVPLYFVDFDELLYQCKPDLLSICTPTETHFEIFKKACLAGVSNIWLEKPAALTIEELQEMMNISKEYNVNVWVNYFRRYDAGFKKVKNRLSEIGKIKYVGAFYTKGFRHNGSHLIDLVHWFFGKIKRTEIIEILHDEKFPSASGIFYSEKAKVNFTALDYKNFELFEIDIIGSNGRIIIKDGGQKIVFEKVAMDKFYNNYKNLETYENHCSSYGMSMMSGLNQGISGGLMPGLTHEMEIQKVFEQCLNYENI